MPSFKEETFIDAPFIEGEEEAKKRIAKFIEKHYSSIENEGGNTIEIYQYVPGGLADEDPIGEVEFDISKKLDKLCEEVVETAAEFCDGVESHKVKFVCKIPGASGQCSFTLTVPDKENSDEVDEAPNTKGLIMQQMRHNQALMKGIITTVEKAASMYESGSRVHMDAYGRSQNRVQFLEEQYTTQLKVYEELLHAQHVRDMDIEQMRNKERRTDQIAQGVMQTMPAIAAKFLGPGAVNNVKSPIELQLEQFIGMFTNEQLQEIAGSGLLSPQQMFGFNQIVMQVIERAQAEKAAAQAAAAQQNGGALPPANPFSQTDGGTPPPNGNGNGNGNGTK